MAKKSKLVVEFPQGKIYKTSKGTVRIEYNKSYVNKFNNGLNLTQVFLDNKVIMHLQNYVSKKYGIQEKSIRLSSNPGSGEVNIGVPYAEYQAYSKRIKKRVGLRGTRPFERMKADKKQSILKDVCAYARRINNG